MPTREQLEAATAVVERARRELQGRLAIDYVIPDYWARRPKPCMGGWGSTILNVTPQGKVMPCHAAAHRYLAWSSSRSGRQLRWIWQESPGVPTLSRHGVDARAVPVLRTQGGRLRWLPLPGAGLGRRCRGHRPACELSPLHEAMFTVAREESAAEPPPSIAGRVATLRSRRRHCWPRARQHRDEASPSRRQSGCT